jgi:hypothetical protein
LNEFHCRVQINLRVMSCADHSANTSLWQSGHSSSLGSDISNQISQTPPNFKNTPPTLKRRKFHLFHLPPVLSPIELSRKMPTSNFWRRSGGDRRKCVGAVESYLGDQGLYRGVGGAPGVGSVAICKCKATEMHWEAVTWVDPFELSVEIEDGEGSPIQGADCEH